VYEAQDLELGEPVAIKAIHSEILDRPDSRADAMDPNIPVVVKKLLSLDTPVSKRIFEIALLLGLIVVASYFRDHYHDSAGVVNFAAGLIGVFGGLVLFVMIFVLLMTVVAHAPKDIESGDKK